MVVPKPVKEEGQKPTRGIRGSNRILGELFNVVFGGCGFRVVVIFIYVLVDMLTGIRNSLFVRGLVSSCVAPVVRDKDHSFKPVLKTVLEITVFCTVNTTSTFVCTGVVICMARNAVHSLHYRVFRRVRDLPVGCFSARPRNSVVDICAGSVSALHRVVDRDVPRLFGDKVAVVTILIDVFALDVPLAVLALMVINMVLFMAGRLTSQDKEFFTGRRTSLNTAGNCVRRVVGNRGIMGMFGRRGGDVRRFGRLGSELFGDSCGTGGFTGVLVPVGTRVNGVDCMLYTVMNYVFTLGGFLKFAVNGLMDFLAFGGDFARPVGRIDRRFGSVIVTLTNTSHVFGLLSRGPRISSKCMALIGMHGRNSELIRARRGANV